MTSIDVTIDDSIDVIGHFGSASSLLSSGTSPFSAQAADAASPMHVMVSRSAAGKRGYMQPVSIFLNILWLLLGGVWMAAGWVVAAIIMATTIIGLPWARAAFNIAVYTLLPFGQRAVRRDSLTGQSDIGTGLFGLIGNLIWLVLAGWWLALGHLVTAVILAVTIIGIPFAWAHLKLAGIALWPIGKAIVPA
jgi:uncharacterized membrane protein YccF (DUF307 family)